MRSSAPASAEAAEPDSTGDPAQGDNARGWASAALRVATAAARVLPWVLVAAALVVGLLSTGTPLPAIGRYAAYWLLGLVLPGTLTFRALRGSRGNLPEDLGYGGVTGLILELVAWALAAATGRQDLLWAWPIPVVLAFLAVPALRRHWRPADRRPLPLGWSWAMAAVLLIIVWWMAGQWTRTPFPLDTFPYYQDLLYHLSLVHELTRDLPFQIPQMAGRPLRYHYLSNAHMATASMISGVDPATVLFRLWLGPIVVAGSVALAAFAREVAGRWWTGPLATLLALVAQMRIPAGQPVTTSSFPLSEVSPSLTYLFPILVLLAALCADLARGRSLGRAWFLFVPAAVTCAGAKANGLPVLIAGLGLAIIACLVATRKIFWPALAGLAAMLATMAAGTAAFAGGGASVLKIQLLSQLPWLAPYRAVTRLGKGPVPGDLLPPGLADLNGAGWTFVLLLLASWVLVQLPRVIGVAALPRRRLRVDGAAWLLAGTLLAGIAGMWLLYHPALSQVYFYQQVVPFGAVLTVVLLADAFPERTTITPFVVGAALGAGIAAAFLLPMVAPAIPYEPTYAAWSWAVAQPILAVGVLATAFGALWFGVRLLFPSLRSHGLAAYLLVLVGFSAVTGVTLISDNMSMARAEAQRAVAAYGKRVVTGAEIRAALWLHDNSGTDDVVATNVHCIPAETRPGCDSRAFWVTGFAGRRTVIESWGYTDEAVAAHGRDGLAYANQPAADEERFELNERIFKDPTADDIHELRRRFAVRWLLADIDAGPVSPRLAEFAMVRLVDGSVTVYELPTP